MSRETPVGSHRRPMVVQNLHSGAPGVHHGLNGEDHAFFETRTASGLAEIRHVGLLVHPSTDAVAHEFTHDGETVLLDPLLYGRGNVAQAIAWPHLVYGAVQGFSRHA